MSSWRTLPRVSRRTRRRATSIHCRSVCALRIGGWSPKDVNDNAETELGRERAEGERIAYVAATRARDLLVVPAVGDQPYTDGWISPLNDVIYPREDVRRQYTPGRGVPAIQKPGFGPAPARRRPGVLPHGMSRASTRLAASRASGSEGVSVVWWAPDALSLGVKASFGLRRDDLIVKDVSAERASAPSRHRTKRGRRNGAPRLNRAGSRAWI